MGGGGVYGLMPTCLLFKVMEELLVEDEGHPTDLLYLGFGCGISVDKVGSDGNSQLTPELFPFEAWERERKNKR